MLKGERGHDASDVNKMSGVVYMASCAVVRFGMHQHGSDLISSACLNRIIQGGHVLYLTNVERVRLKPSNGPLAQ